MKIENLLSPEYQQSQKEFHQLRPDYGVVGRESAGDIFALIHVTGAKSVLDYGCGKRTLGHALEGMNLGVALVEYDPAIPGHDALPPACDVVYCGDVLEHIEPDKLDAVIHCRFRRDYR